MKNNEAQRESRKKEKMERELKTAKTELESKGGELKTKQNQLQKALDDISRLEQQLKEQRVSYCQQGFIAVLCLVTSLVGQYLFDNVTVILK